MFAAFHHFRPKEAARVLVDALTGGAGIAVFEYMVSAFRIYSPGELLALAPPDGGDRYRWRSGRLRHPKGSPVIYLIGTPREQGDADPGLPVSSDDV